MNRDSRDTDLYREAELLYRTLRQPGTGHISEIAEVHASPDGRYAVCAGSIMDVFEGLPQTRICRIDLTSLDTRVMTFGPNSDRSPKYAPDGRTVAFLSDRHRSGDFQLFLLDPMSGAVQPAPQVAGWIEYLHWSPDGKRILLGVAGHGADIAGGQGAITSQPLEQNASAWMPVVDTGAEERHWRRAWIYELETNRVHQVPNVDLNIWETVWCGNESILAVASPGPAEGLWYTARLYQIDVASGRGREMHRPRDQLGWPAASPSGRHTAIVEAVCSDRWFVAGDLRLFEGVTGESELIDTHGADITFTEWRSENILLLAGHRGFETVVGLFDVSVRRFIELWCSDEVTISGRYASVAGVGSSGDCVMATESFTRAPEIGVLQARAYRTVKSFDAGYSELAQCIGGAERVTWSAPDGLEIQGWLLRPRSEGPHALVMSIHGGPVGHSRPVWLGRWLGAPVLMLLRRGYAVFYPNPRGSSGRGQAFARHMAGDMGGADTDDYISGLDHLIAQGIADPTRIGVTGASYGGFMTCWLITQHARFAAAVAVNPATHHVSQHLLCNIPQFVSLFLADRYDHPRGKYHSRSPIMHARKVTTPTLNICGALDRCTPPAEALQFHNALLENGVVSVLATYPEEGHGIRKFPATIDFAARLVGWFQKHMSARCEQRV